MKLYESYFQIEQLWMKVQDILTGEITEGSDGLPVDAEAVAARLAVVQDLE